MVEKDMLKNFCVIAWRNISKSPFYSLVNIVGLSMGLVTTLLIGAYVWSALQVNSSLKHIENQYIIQSKWKNTNQGFEIATIGPLAKALKDQYPDLVANYYRYDGITTVITKNDKSFRENIQLGDSTLLNMYGFDLLYGNPQKVFGGPYSVLITEEKAIKFFGSVDVVGQTLTIASSSGQSHDFIVTGVMKNTFRNSVTHIGEDYDNQVFLSISSLNFFNRNMNWNNSAIVSYVELQNGIKPKDLVKPIQYILKQNAPPQMTSDLEAYLTPLKTYYLDAENGLVKKMNYTLSGIAFFILIMAIINFVNISISRSTTRMREIGIRKVLGSRKDQLVLQFLLESMILVLFSVLLSIIWYVLLKPLASNILGKSLPGLIDFPMYFLWFPILLILIIGYVSGIYPALILSSLKSVESLKGKVGAIKEKNLFRQSLVVFQFTASIIVFTGAILISRQINLFFSKSLGYDKTYIISAQVPRNWSVSGVERMETVRQQFASMPQVGAVTLSFEIPDGNNSGSILIYKMGNDSTTGNASITMLTDENYASTYGIQMVAGNFYGHHGSVINPTNIAINETQAKLFGWNDPSQAIGKQVKYIGFAGTLTIAGVVKDFHFSSMQQEIQPITFLPVKLTSTYRFLSFKLKPGNMKKTLSELQKRWTTLMPGSPFEYSFMDESLKKLYQSEIQLQKAAYVSTAFSMIIVLLGVLGLVSLNIQKRTKEIGIRKVLGSSVISIIFLFIKEFLPMVLIAGLFAGPVTYWIMKKWLDNYAYKIELNATPFLITMLFLGFVTALLIMVQTFKAALTNPAKSLKME